MADPVRGRVRAMGRNVRVMIVAARTGDVALVRHQLTSADHDVTIIEVRTAADLGAELDRGSCDLLIVCGEHPELSVRAAVSLLESHAVDVPVLVLGNMMEEAAGLEAMGEGAADFISRENPARMRRVLEREL